MSPSPGPGKPGQSLSVRLDDQNRAASAHNEEIPADTGQPSDTAFQQVDVEWRADP